MSEVSEAVPVNPYDGYKQLREQEPVSRMEADGPYQVARHADVLAVLRDHQTYSSDVSLRPPEERNGPSMLFSDPPLHNRLRKLVSYAFKPGHIEAQRGLIHDRCEELMRSMIQHQEVELVDALAAPLPVVVIATMLGVAEGDIRQFKHWSDTIFSNIGDILFAEPSAEVVQAGEELDAYFLERIDELRRRPVDHVLGRLVETETEDGKLSNEELLSFCRLLLIAGNETTTGLITAAVRIFHEFPWTFARLRQEPQLIRTFIEETLRFYSPFSATVRRTTEDTQLAGVTIPQGSLVVPLIASANRDEAVFEHADEFVIDRDPNPHVAFGYGIHNCLGAHLARLEGEIAVASMLQHLRSIRFADGEAPEPGQLGGPSSLRVVLEAA
jgi:cytochrome P450